MLYTYRPSTWMVILFLLVFWPVASILLTSDQFSAAQIKNLTLEVYLSTLLVEILLILIVAWALLRAKEGPATVGLVSFNPKNILIGVLFLFFAATLFNFLSHFIRSLEQPEEIAHLLPRTNLDYAVWILLSLVAAIGEELSFRGFLITRMAPVLGSYWAAALLSSIAFGFGHFYQGPVGVLFTGIYGLLFAGLFYWRKSLVPCIVAHFLQDALAPWFFRLTE